MNRGLHFSGNLKYEKREDSKYDIREIENKKYYCIVSTEMLREE